MGIEEIKFLRHPSPEVGKPIVLYGSINDSREQLTIPELQELFDFTIDPVPALVEAHQPDPDSDYTIFCGSRYNFFPYSGIISSNAGVELIRSTIGIGSVLHPNVEVIDSQLGNNCEISNTTSIINSRLGNLCMVGIHAVLEDQTLGNLSAVDDFARLSAEVR